MQTLESFSCLKKKKKTSKIYFLLQLKLIRKMYTDSYCVRIYFWLNNAKTLT